MMVYHIRYAFILNHLLKIFTYYAKLFMFKTLLSTFIKSYNFTNNLDWTFYSYFET